MEPGPVDRFIPTVDVDRLLDGTGKNVGVCGRAVDGPPPECLDCGRRTPVLTDKGFIGPVLREGDVERATVEAAGRKDVGAVPFESLRFSFRPFAILFF